MRQKFGEARFCVATGRATTRSRRSATLRVLLTASVALAGCATDPLAHLETTTPTLTSSQRANLLQHAKSPAELGLPAGLANVAIAGELTGAESVTLPLFKVPTPEPGVEGGKYGVPVVLATVNGQPNVRVMLDSGSNRNLFGYSLAQSLNVPVIAGVNPVTSTGIGGTMDSYFSVVESLRFDSIALKRVLALIGPDTQVLNVTRGFWNNPQTLVLGMNTLRSLAYVTIDAPAGTVTFSPRESYRPRAGAKFVTGLPLRWENDLPMVDVGVDGHVKPCVIDTGGDYGLLLPKGIAGELGYWTPGKETLGFSKGVGGTSMSAMYFLKEAQIGSAHYVNFQAQTELSGPAVAGGHVLLGNVCLRRLRVTFDFQRGQFWLER